MIHAKDLTKKFEDTVALNGLNGNIPSGCIYGLVGANGSGKSTFLRLIAGVYRPDAGTISVDGAYVSEQPKVREQIAFVPDDAYFLPSSDLRRMMLLYEANNPRFSRALATELADRFRLPVRRSIGTFSKGMKRQAAILLALASEPRYLLMDETFDGLDPVVRNMVKNLLYESMLDRDMTVVMTSHSLRELEDTCDQLALLHQGGIVFESDVQNLKTSLFKVQIAFAEPFGKERFEKWSPLHYIQQGSVATFLLRGDREAIKAELFGMEPLLLELLPLTLEEVFVHELDALGYSFEKEEVRAK